MKITQITNQHLTNRIAYFKRKLAKAPSEQCYIGESDYAESAVEQENTHNNLLAQKIESHINYMKKEARKRGLV